MMRYARWYDQFQLFYIITTIQSFVHAFLILVICSGLQVESRKLRYASDKIKVNNSTVVMAYF